MDTPNFSRFQQRLDSDSSEEIRDKPNLAKLIIENVTKLGQYLSPLTASIRIIRNTVIMTSESVCIAYRAVLRAILQIRQLTSEARETEKQREIWETLTQQIRVEDAIIAWYHRYTEMIKTKYQNDRFAAKAALRLARRVLRHALSNKNINRT